MTDDPAGPALTAAAEEPPAEQEPASRARTIRKVAIRVMIIVGVLALSGWVLFNVFDDLDWGEIRSAIGELSDAEWLSLAFGWLVWIVVQGASSPASAPANRAASSSAPAPSASPSSTSTRPASSHAADERSQPETRRTHPSTYTQPAPDR